ncbi:hypothetical protein KJ766_03660 [Patescibacteria group bacterium]|nr:hypothetical protein [Patescibacteria group bacterium]
MKKQWRTFWRSARRVFSNKFFYIATGFAGLFLVLSLFIIWWKLFPEIAQQTAIPLHYNTHFGVDLFGPWWQIFLVPIFQLSILIVNVVVAIIVWQKDVVLAKMTLVASVITNILLFLSMIFIVLLNLSYYG